MHLRGRWRCLGRPPAHQGTRDSVPRRGLDGCGLRDRVRGSWGQQDPCPGWQPLLQGSMWGDAHTSVGDALLHLGAQLREEHVLSRLLRRVIEENLKERKTSKKQFLLSHPVTSHWACDIKRFSRAPRCDVIKSNL